jgi:hypothetical protein
MQWRAAFRSGAGLICLFAATVAGGGPPIGPAPTPQSPEVMLYMSWPIGAGGPVGRLPGLSLRVGQARLGANSGNPSAGDPMQHRELFRVEVFGRPAGTAPDMRLELGGRMTYDLQRGVFGLHADGWKRPSIVPAGPPTATAIQFQSARLSARLWELSSLKHGPLSGASKPSVVIRGSTATAPAIPVLHR